jgi:hypothetical protein
VAQIGPVSVTREKDFPVPLAPIIGGVAVLAGAARVIKGSRTTA